jgi:predicted outer membrane repeat protein
MRFASFCSAAITGCSFVENSARNGGGVNGDECSLAITSCTFSGNTAEYRGGGLWLFCEDSYPTITECVFSENTAGWDGGGVSSWGFEPTFTGCIFANNSAAGNGGGLRLSWYWQSVIGCTFYGNRAGGLGGAVYSNEASVDIANCILSFSQDGGAVWCEGSPVPEITHCCVYGNAGAAGDSLCGVSYDNLFVDPVFCDASGGDFTLRSDSPCLPSNNPWGELVGALGQGCDVSAVEPTSWGKLKAMFR